MNKQIPHLKDCRDALFFAEVALNRILGTYKIEAVENV